jgi:tetratricopeptide (TPR) repeat protein
VNQPAPSPSPDDGSTNVPPDDVAAALSTPTDLPEDEPLTPEILEDEAIRGDFVLRWVIVALAILLGCAQLNDALPLVHVRAGEWLAAHGFLPRGQEPFSIAAADRPWIQLEWLFDLLAAGVYSVSGGIGLSLAAGILAALTFTLVVQSHRRHVRTWWAAVCAALALIAAYDRFDFAPAAWTLLGVATILAILVYAENTGLHTVLWCVVPLMLIWSQLSSQAWIGAMLLILYWLGALLDRPRIADQPVIALPSMAVLGPMLVAAIAMLLHPFTWHTWEAAWTRYTVEYPTFRDLYPRPIVVDLVWHPLWSELVWEGWTHRLIAGVALAVIAGLCLLLNRRRVSWAHTFVYLGGNALGLAALHDLPIASLINAVLAGIHAQEWYHDRFGQIYTVAWAEVAFSRGGRAVTLLAFFALAWAIISGRIDGPDGRRTGVGLSRALQVELDTYQQLNDITIDDRGFHITVRQGDFLIAAGRKSVVDRRVALFTGDGDSDLYAWFERVRKGFLPPNTPEEAQGQAALRREAMERYKLSHAVLRLLQPRDDSSLPVLLSTGDWSLTAILPTAAVFHHMNAVNPAQQKQIAEQSVNHIIAGFRPEIPALDEPPLRPIMPTWSQLLISQPRTQRTAATAQALHYLRLGAMARRASWPYQAGCYHLAIRSARAGVRDDIQQAEPYLVLGEAYAALAQLEYAVLAEIGVSWNRSLRYYEAIAALQQAVQIRPDSAEGWHLLFQLYQDAGQVDAALTSLQKFLSLTPITEETSEESIRQRERLLDFELNLEGRIATVRKELDRLRESQSNAFDLAMFAYQNGCIELAVQLMQEDAISLERNPMARQFMTLWLAELGQRETLDDSAQRLESVSGQLPVFSWRNPVAFAAVSRGDYAAAVKVWDGVAPRLNQLTLQSLFETMAMSRGSPVFLSDFQFPIVHLQAAQQGLEQYSYESLEAQLHTGLCEMERGNTSAAAQAFREALEAVPDTPLRPLLRLYLYCLTDELIDVEPPGDWIPHPADLFAPEPTNSGN